MTGTFIGSFQVLSLINMNNLEVSGSEIIVNIGTRKQLFFDDYILESNRWITPLQAEVSRWIQPPPKDGENGEGAGRIEGDIPGHLIKATFLVTRTVNQPRKYEGNPIMVKDRPWEGCGPFAPAVLKDEEEGIFKMWYQSWSRRKGYWTMYATSKDGIHWNKPQLDVIRHGEQSTNIVSVGTEMGRSVFKDPEEADPKKRYKAPYSHPTEKGLYELRLAYSPDGIHWSQYPGPFDSGRGDEVTYFMYDPVNEKYVLFTRNPYPYPHLKPRSKRCIFRAQSSNLIDWSMSAPIIVQDQSDPPDIDFYDMKAIFYESLYVGFLTVHHTASDTLDVYLTYSRDGFHWRRFREKPFLPLGSPGSWDSGMVSVGSIMKMNDEIWIYYSGWDGPHGSLKRRGAIGLAKLRIDGFVSMDAAEMEEYYKPHGYQVSLLTKPLYSPGNRLVVNVDASEGYIEAELLDLDGNVIKGYSREDCDTFRGDSVNHVFTWNGNPDISGKLPARIRFYMKKARLYALQIPKVSD